jgi:hypothetical protein
MYGVNNFFNELIISELNPLWLYNKLLFSLSCIGLKLSLLKNVNANLNVL